MYDQWDVLYNELDCRLTFVSVKSGVSFGSTIQASSFSCIIDVGIVLFKVNVSTQ